MQIRPKKAESYIVVAARRDAGQGAARRNAIVRPRLLAGAVQPAQSQEPHGGGPVVPRSIPPAIESSPQPGHGSRADASTLPRARSPGTFYSPLFIELDQIVSFDRTN
jgi:hypothetical protein